MATSNCILNLSLPSNVLDSLPSSLRSFKSFFFELKVQLNDLTNDLQESVERSMQGMSMFLGRQYSSRRQRKNLSVVCSPDYHDLLVAYNTLFFLQSTIVQKLTEIYRTKEVSIRSIPYFIALCLKKFFENCAPLMKAIIIEYLHLMQTKFKYNVQ